MAKLILFDFECTACGVVFEDLIPSDEHTCPCKCGAVAQRMISGTRLDWRNMGVDPDFATCADKWAKMQEQKSRIEQGYNLVHY
jgi:putative FmdB family regulatory protein